MTDFKNAPDPEIENVHLACYQIVEGRDRDKYDFILEPTVAYHSSDPRPWVEWTDGLRRWYDGLWYDTKTICITGRAPIPVYIRTGMFVGRQYDLCLPLGREQVTITPRALRHRSAAIGLPAPVLIHNNKPGLAVLFVTQNPAYTFDFADLPADLSVSKVWNACIATNGGCHETTIESFDDDASRVSTLMCRALNAVDTDPDCVGLCLATSLPTALACVMGTDIGSHVFHKPVVLVDRVKGKYVVAAQFDELR